MEYVFMPITAIGVAILAFTVVFHFAAQISWRYLESYRNFSIQEQKDWCARYVKHFIAIELDFMNWYGRINSTLHASVIVPCMLFTLLQQRWDEDYMPLRSTRLSNIFFALSMTLSTEQHSS